GFVSGGRHASGGSAGAFAVGGRHAGGGSAGGFAVGGRHAGGGSAGGFIGGSTEGFVGGSTEGFVGSSTGGFVGGNHAPDYSLSRPIIPIGGSFGRDFIIGDIDEDLLPSNQGAIHYLQIT
ncbi:glycine-rich cell wall structural protein-like, partial [Limulus polyphemus]|uniref:Glycine-rich cell wall structural protein-like n=1 Tax=Limulus polyphemus TaxID=6850 RepID=A0ABM1BWG7_LIMPO